MPPTSTLPSSADALTALNSFQMPDSASVLGQAQQQYGVQGAQDRVNTYKTLTNNLTGAIAAVDPSVTGRTSGSLVTEGQRGALVNRERAPIVSQLGTANQGLNSATGDLTTANTNAKDAANMTIADNTTKYNRLKDNYTTANAREQAAQQLADTQAKFDYQKQQDAITNNQNQQKINISGSNSAAVKPVSGYNVKQFNSGNLAYTGPDGSSTNLYQYAQAVNGGNQANPDDVLATIKTQLSGGSATDKGAATGIAKLQKQGLSTSQIIARLKGSNGYIFN